MNDHALRRNESSHSLSEHPMRAALDLMRRIPGQAPRRIADVYKGRGSMRALLACRFPDAEIETFDLLHLTDRHPNPGSRRLSTGHKFDLTVRIHDDL